MQSLSQYSSVISPSGSQLVVYQLMQIPFQVLFFWVSPKILYVNLSFAKYPLGLRVEGHCKSKCRCSCAVLFKEVYVLFGVATPLWPSVGVKPNTWKSWRFGVLRDSRMFRAQQQGPKHLALGCSWCH